MLTKNGQLFHIDFGHFLGNVKKKFGIKRERTPFILTSDFVAAMEGEDGSNFEKFIDLSTKAFVIVRQNANLILNLLSLVIFFITHFFFSFCNYIQDLMFFLFFFFYHFYS